MHQILSWLIIKLIISPAKKHNQLYKYLQKNHTHERIQISIITPPLKTPNKLGN